MSSPTTSRRLVLVAPALDARTSDVDRRSRALDFVRRVDALLPDVEKVVASFDSPDALADIPARVIAATDTGSLIAAAFAADAVIVGPTCFGNEAVNGSGDGDLLGEGTSGLEFAAGLACVAAIVDRPLWVLGASVADLSAEPSRRLAAPSSSWPPS